jgi:N-acetylmuramoyl-L-alanine amidase
MLILAAVFAASLLLVTFSAPGAEAQTTTTGVLTGKKVVLDAGDGGSDPGASNAAYNLKEKDQNLDVAYKLEALLETSGTTVYMTPTGEQTLSNYDR